MQLTSTLHITGIKHKINFLDLAGSHSYIYNYVALTCRFNEQCGLSFIIVRTFARREIPLISKSSTSMLSFLNPIAARLTFSH